MPKTTASAFPPQDIEGGGTGTSKHTELTDKEVGGVIDHADDSIPMGKLSGHDKAAHDALSIDAATLGGSSKAQIQDHVPQAHTLTSHSTKAHSELTGIGTDDHHAINHEARHISGGLDPFISTDLLEAIVKRLRESGGATLLLGSITDGQYFQRSGNNVIGATPSGSLPTGIIVMWSGLLADIPSGWALCDGGDGRPDLRDKFIVGASPSEEPGGTGGSLTKTHAGVTVGDHPALAHSQPTQAAVKVGTSASNAAPLAHTHPDHALQTHTVTQPSDHSDIRPPYYKVVFIIKT